MVHSLLLLLVLAASGITGDDPVDSIKKKITKAEEAHRLELAKAQADVIKWLDERDATARKKGDKATVNLVKLQREKLETEGTIPKPIPVNMSRKVDTARDLLDASYVSLLKEALIAKLDELADEIEDKRVQLAKGKADVNVFNQVKHMAKNMVQNGSFEWPEVPNGLDHLPIKGDGWTISFGDVCRFKGALPVQGNQLLQFGGDITQLVNGFIPGERYVVTAYVATYSTPKIPKSSSIFKVNIAGEEQSVTLSSATNGSKTAYQMPGKEAKWEQITLIFKALGESHELKISGNGDLSVLDQVSILPFLGN